MPRSVDGWTAGFPTEWVTAPERPRDALIAVKMNDEPLPAAHGFPARLIVPGLYGYVSATKWLSRDRAHDARGVRLLLGPARLGQGGADPDPVADRRPGARTRRVAAGQVAVAGVAWAPDRGISRVEVQVDDGRVAGRDDRDGRSGPRRGSSGSSPGRRRAGEHTLTVRATDGTGEVQTDMVTRPDPDGARGYHRIAVSVG